jgi:serine/threonine-protein kinase RsbW
MSENPREEFQESVDDSSERSPHPLAPRNSHLATSEPGAQAAPPGAAGDLVRILLVEPDPATRETLVSAFIARGCAVTPVDSVDEASRWIDSDAVDIVVTDLKSATIADSQLMRTIRKQRAIVPVVVTLAGHDAETVSTLRNGTTDVLQLPFEDREVDRVIERSLACRLRHIDCLKILPYATEHIEFKIPSRVEFLDGILNYLTERLIRMGIIEHQNSNVVIALDEAIVNAIKHGNRYDETKSVTIVADLSLREARFTITDQGEGFDPQDVPDPCAPENLLRSSGRGLLLIRNIMDETCYNERGNSLMMVKRAGSAEE